jgi:membrane-associated phospholipid phosphatase
MKTFGHWLLHMKRSQSLLPLPFTLFMLVCLLSKQEVAAQESADTLILTAPSFQDGLPDRSAPIHVMSFREYSYLLKDNFRKQASFPFSTRAKDREILLGLGMVATAGLLTDWETNKRLGELRHTSSFVRVNSPVIGQMGASYSFAVLGITGACGYIFRNEKAQCSFLLATQAAMTTGFWTHVVKFATSRTRPNEYNRWEGPGYHFRPLKKDQDDHLWSSEFNSFPSGHTSNAFAIATVFAKMYRDIPAVPVIAYGTAALVGLSRMIENRHWGSDVLMGAALGYFCGSQVVNNYWRRFGLHGPGKGKTDISLRFESCPGYSQLSLNYKF